MSVTDIRSFQRQREIQHQHELHKQAAEALNDEVEVIRHFAINTHSFGAAVQGWFYHEMGKRPPVDQIAAFYLTVSSAFEYLGEDVVEALCIEYGSDDLRRWAIIEGLAQVGQWVEQFGMIPRLEDPDTILAYVNANFPAIQRWLITKLIQYYRDLMPSVNETRYMTIAHGPQLSVVPCFKPR